MDESKRTKILAGILVAVVGFGFLRPDKILLEPIQQARTNLQNARQKHDAASLKDMQRAVAEQELEDARLISVMPEPTVALAQYQTWLTNLAEQCNFVQPDVVPGASRRQEGRYTSVSVNLETEATMEDLSRFLFLFDQADLLHRISKLQIESTGSTGKPRMEIVLVAEAYSVDGATDRDNIFPVVKLPQNLPPEVTELTLPVTEDFPQKKPFLAMIGREMVQVESINDNTLKLRRGQNGSTPLTHTADESFELFPVAPLKKEATFDQYASFLKNSPFLKPIPEKKYEPRLTVQSQTVTPGDTVVMTPKVDGINKDIGDVEIRMLESIDGMTFDDQSGQFQWSVPKDQAPNTYKASFVLTQKNNADLRIEKEATFKVQLPNEAPVLQLADTALVILGRDFKQEFQAQDDGGSENLTYEFDGEIPEGLSIEENRFVWAPPRTFLPGKYEVTLKASDKGTPAKSTTAKITFDVQDDIAATTRLTGATIEDGIGRAWIWNQAQDESYALEEGDRLTIADIRATVTKISNRFIEFRDDEGLWKLELGKFLRNRKLLQAAGKTDQEENAETENVKTEEAKTEEAKTEKSEASNADNTDQPSAGAGAS